MKVSLFWRILGIGWFFCSMSWANSLPSSFCPDPSWCVEINTGNRYLGEECVLVRDPNKLKTLFSWIEKLENTGTSQTVEEALDIVNQVQDKKGFFLLTAKNFSRNQIVFVALSLPKKDRYFLTVSNPKKNVIQLGLGVVQASFSKGDRTKQVLPGPFFQVVALTEKLLQKFSISSWSRVSLWFESSENLSPKQCSSDFPRSS